MMRNTAADQIDRDLQQLFSRDAALDIRGNACLEFANGIRLHIETPEDHSLGFVHGEVAKVTEETALRRALQMNHFGVAPAGAWLALDPETSVLRLCATLSGGGPDTLDATLSAIISSIMLVRARLADGHHATTAAPTESPIEPVFETFALRI